MTRAQVRDGTTRLFAVMAGIIPGRATRANSRAARAFTGGAARRNRRPLGEYRVFLPGTASVYSEGADSFDLLAVSGDAARGNDERQEQWD
jgi:hypothetical protein